MDDETLLTWLTLAKSTTENLGLLLNRDAFEAELLAADRATAERALRDLMAGFQRQFGALANLGGQQTSADCDFRLRQLKGVAL